MYYFCAIYLPLSFRIAVSCADDPDFKDASGAGCSSWKGAGDRACTDAEIHRVQEKCQQTCNLCAPNETSCSDTKGFVDSKGYGCRDGWRGIACTNQFMRELRDRCPATCGLCLPCDASLWSKFNAAVECKTIGGKPDVLSISDSGPCESGGARIQCQNSSRPPAHSRPSHKRELWRKDGEHHCEPDVCDIWLILRSR